MKNSIAFIVIGLAVVAVAVGGSLLTDSGMAWYATLQLPAFTPPGGVIGLVWTTIFLLSAVAVMLIWSARTAFPHFGSIIALLVINGVLNVLWSYVFFVAHQLGLAVAEMIVLNLTTLAIIILSWNRQRVAALLLLPYFAWVCFATYLAVVIWRMNGLG